MLKFGYLKRYVVGNKEGKILGRMKSVSCFTRFFVHVLVVVLVLVLGLRRCNGVGDMGGTLSSREIARSATEVGSKVCRVFHHLSDKVHSNNHERRRLAPVFGQALNAVVGYLVPVEIGTPGQEQHLLMDTSSAMTWVDTLPCPTCATPTTYFDPTMSTTFTPIPCSDPTCSPDSLLTCTGQGCTIELDTLTGNLSTGTLAKETLTLVPTSGTGASFNGLIIAAVNDNKVALDIGQSGVMGLNQEPFSLVSQAQLPAFAHCFPSFTSSGAGVLIFGHSGLNSTLDYTPILPHPLSQAYYVSITGISVDGQPLSIDPSVFEVDPTDGTGGTMIHSATLFTMLKEPAYTALRDAFVAGLGWPAGGTPTLVPSPVSFLDGCFTVDLTDTTSMPTVPAVSILFSPWGSAGTTKIDLALESLLVAAAVDSSSGDYTLCMAFSSSGSIDLNVVGSYQQQNLYVEYDLASSRIGFKPADCVAILS